MPLSPAAPVEDLPRYEIPPPPNPVGHAAISHEVAALHWAERSVRLAEQDSPIGALAARSLVEQKLGYLHTELSAIREGLATQTPDHVATLDRYLEHYYTDPVDPRFASRTAWLSSPDGAGDGELLSLLHRHEHRLQTRQQSPAFAEAAAASKHQYLTAVRWAVQEGGWLHPHMSYPAQIQGIAQTKIYIGDLWDTTLKGSAGYHHLGSDYIVVSQGMGVTAAAKGRDGAEILNDVTFHELTHKQVDTKNLRPRWYREAWAEHSDIALQDLSDQSFATFDPDERQQAGLTEKHRYYQERKILAALWRTAKEAASARGVQLDDRILTVAGSCDTTSDISWLRFTEALDDAWQTKDMFGKTTRYIQNTERNLREVEAEKVQAAAEAQRPYRPKTQWEIQEEAARQGRHSLEAYASTLKELHAPHKQRVGTAVLSVAH